MKKSKSNTYLIATWVLALAVFASPLAAFAQTRVEIPDNKYSISDDIKLGRQAAAEVERQMPTLPEGGVVDDYVESVGRRLVNAVPSEYRRPQFNYEFDVVNARDINAFALPGGYMYVNRGMIEAADSEGEMAGVMAHELAHVVLRHGTAQASKAQSPKFQLPAIGGAILGAIIGGGLGSVIAQGTQFGLSAYFLKYSRDYERQADILGAQIMARAGYDPRDLANMFRTIEREGGGRGGPEWLSSHPNPGNRYEAINREAQLLRVSSAEATQDTASFRNIQARLRDMPRAPSMQEIARNQQQNPNRYPDGARVERRVEYPSSRYRTYRGGNVFEVSVPDNWRNFSDSNSVTFAPEGAYGYYQNQPVFTHGAIVGVARAGTSNLRQASDMYINALLQNNPYLRPQSGYRSGSLDGRRALAMQLGGISQATGRAEVVNVYTTMTRNGELFYVITVTPRDEARYYDQTFNRLLQSIELNA
ncbi:MAG TPA: M48 family metallopeptidase [Blastocatellia bacterium]|nr:M48 family metallopeptidase [Blastocatellia bacterium]